MTGSRCGANNRAAEIGAMQVRPEDGREHLGVGGVRDDCSGPGIVGNVSEQLAAVDEVHAQTVFECATVGDDVAVSIWIGLLA